MSNSSERGEEWFAERLAAYDAALAGGTPYVDDTLDDEDLKLAKACLDQLEAAWPRRQVAGRVDETLVEGSTPATLGRFQILRELGRGGGGIVYLANDPQLHRQVALKVPRAESLFSPELRRRFLREAEAAAQLSHRNIVPVHEAGEVAGVCYLVSEYCPGVTLATWLIGKVVSPRDAALIARELADGLAHVHARNVCHRDVKPTNVLLNFDENAAPLGFVPKLTDFGLAKLDSAMPRDEGDVTRTGAILGTPAYMAPEAADGRTHDIGPATDVYGLGVVLYQLLVGYPPFRGTTDLATLKQIVTEEPEPPRRRRRAMPPDLEAVCLKCLAKRPKDRYATAAALRDDLANFLEGRPTVARPLSTVQRALKWVQRRPTATALAATIVLAIIGVVVATSWYAVETEKRNKELTKANAELEATALKLRQGAYADGFDRALASYKEGRVTQAVSWLNDQMPPRGEKDLRGFEWHYLKGLCHPIHAVWRGHVAGLDCVASSPDGKSLACSSSKDEFWIRDVASGRTIANLRGHKARPRFVAFTPDGGRLLSANQDEEAELLFWDTTTAQLVRRVPLGNVPKIGGALSPDGKTIALATYNGFGFWDVPTGQQRAYHPVSNGRFHAIAFAPDGQTVAAGDRIVRVWDVRTGEATFALHGHAEEVLAIAFSPEGRTLATGGNDDVVRLWDVVQQAQRAVLKHQSGVNALAFSPDGRMLATTAGKNATSNVGEVKIWDVQTGSLLATFESEIGKVNALTFVNGTELLALGCADKTVKLLDTRPAPGVRQLVGHAPKETWDLAFSPDGRILASAGDDHHVRLWDAVTGQELFVLKGHKSLVTAIAFTVDGAGLASIDYAGKLILWDVATRTSRMSIEAKGQQLRCLAISPDGRWLAAGNRSKGSAEVHVWDAATGREVIALPHARSVDSLGFTVDGQTLVSAGEDGVIRWWDVKSWNVSRELHDDDQVRVIAFSPDGATLASANVSGGVRLWDVATGLEKHPMRGHVEDVFALAFSPDGRTLCTGGMDKSVHLWQVATGQQLLLLEGHATRVNAVAFSPDGRSLATAGHDGLIKIWSSAPSAITPSGHDGWGWASTFGTDGILTTPIGDHCWANGMTIQPDGKILVAGIETARKGGRHSSLVVRYQPSGQLDAAFGAAGVATLKTSVGLEEAVRVAVLPDGKIVVAGKTAVPDHGLATHVARLGVDGQFDRSFGTEGSSVVHLLKGDVGLAGMAVQADGKVLVAAYVDKPTGQAAVARLTANGSPDLAFGDSGQARIVFDQKQGSWISGLAVQPDGRILLAGNAGDASVIARLMPDGKQFDESFGVKGIVLEPAPPGLGRGAPKLVVLPDERILVAHCFDRSDTSVTTLARYLPDGNPDATFGTNGRRKIDALQFTPVGAMALQTDGKILIAGMQDRTLKNAVFVRYTADGQVDPTFGRAGQAIIALPNPDRVVAIAVQPNGKIVAAGHVRRGDDVVGSLAVFRLLSDGRLDAPGTVARPWPSEAPR